jgi:hypothetical protein
MYGVLVRIFQDGHLSGVLDFTPTGPGGGGHVPAATLQLWRIVFWDSGADSGWSSLRPSLSVIFW